MILFNDSSHLIQYTRMIQTTDLFIFVLPSNYLIHVLPVLPVLFLSIIFLSINANKVCIMPNLESFRFNRWSQRLMIRFKRIINKEDSFRKLWLFTVGPAHLQVTTSTTKSGVSRNDVKSFWSFFFFFCFSVHTEARAASRIWENYLRVVSRWRSERYGGCLKIKMQLNLS